MYQNIQSDFVPVDNYLLKLKNHKSLIATTDFHSSILVVWALSFWKTWKSLLERRVVSNIKYSKPTYILPFALPVLCFFSEFPHQCFYFEIRLSRQPSMMLEHFPQVSRKQTLFLIPFSEFNAIKSAVSL